MKMKNIIARIKKGLSILLVIMMSASAFIINAPTSVYAVTEFAGGDGLSGNPYQIETAQQLPAMNN